MGSEERRELLLGLASGDLAARDLARLAARDVVALEGLVARLVDEGRHHDAAQIAEFLAQLEPDRPGRLLIAAEAHRSAGERQRSLNALRTFFNVDVPRPPAEVARALALRIALLSPIDAGAATADLEALRVLAERDERARAILDEVIDGPR